VTPGLGLAQHGGGGHGGGGHGGGGGHFGGGSHFGGGRIGGFSGGRVGGFRGGFRDGDRFGHHRGFGYGYYGGYYPYPYDTYPYDSGYYGSGYDGSYGDVTPYYSDSYPSVAPAVSNYPYVPAPAHISAPPDTSAHVTVNVPADTQLWFDGTATTTTGSVRQFDTPSLTPGSKFSYEVRARWNDNGHEVTQTQQVEVRSGARINVSFPVPSTTTEQGSTVKKGG
jgi:uncharacterized protein (TIGR03000 family)